jgi:sulfur-oxidizing protein SoxA
LRHGLRGGLAILALAGLLMPAAGLQAQSAQDTAREIERYREAVADSSPGELWEVRGEDLWKTARGPRGVSLERCDLGEGPGVVAGAYARLPRWFADAGQVMDLETRLLHCMVTLQGFDRATLIRQPFGSGQQRSDFEALSAWIAAESRGRPIEPPLAHPAERAAWRLGREIFHVRGGPHDFACTTCHGEPGRRIRLQDLPNLSDPADARRTMATWPAYRVSQGEMRTLQWRMNDCFRQQRFPDLIFGSPASVALVSYLMNNARGAPLAAPGVRR